MTKKNGTWLRLMSLGLVICLAFPACRTSEEKVSDADELSTSSDAACEVTKRLKRITIPDMTFYPPATIIDALDFLTQASMDYDVPSVPLDQRGVGYILRLNQDPSPVANEATEPTDVFASAATASRDLPRIAAMSVRFISLYDALNLVCEATDMNWRVSGGKVLITPKEQDGVCISRSYTVPHALSDKLFNERHGPASNAAPNTVWEAFFKELGVTGPTNATVEYLPFAKRLDVTNTPENMELVEKVFKNFAMRTVEVEMEIHAFSTSDIERLHLSGGMSLESLMKLRESGKSKSVATASVLTKSGQEAIMRAVQEVIYPTELTMDFSQIGSNCTERSAVKALKPSNFATRETGMILQVVPEVFEEERSKINLTLKPQWITLDGWTTFPASWSVGGGIKSSTFKQPIFGVTSFETQAVLTDGETIMLGSCSTPDGEWVHVGFLTARLQDVESGPWGSCREKTNSRNELKNAAVAEKLKKIVVPKVSSRLPASTTIVDVVRSLKDASIQYDSGVPEMERGINFVLKVSRSFWEQKQDQSFANVDIFAEPESGTNGVPYIPPTDSRSFTLCDTLRMMCDLTGMKFEIKDGIVWIEPSSVYKENYKWWIYPLPTSSCEIISPGSCSQTNDFSEQKYISFFEKLGVQWPMGARVRYLPSVDMICFKTSRSGMDSIKKVLDDDLGCKPLCLEVDVQIHAFPAEEIDRLRRASEITVETLMDLRRMGKSKQVASATVLTKSGHEAIMKSVREILYPADLMTDVNFSNSNITVQTSAHALVPSEFVMRETGMILQVVPEMSERGQSQISVLVKPTWVTLDRWEPYSADLAEGLNHSMIPFKQPVFGMKSFETQTTVKDGETVLLGSSATTDNKSVQFGFLTVKRKRISGDSTKNVKK